MKQKLEGAVNTEGRPLGDVDQQVFDWQVDEYWRNIIENQTNALNMPLDYVRPAVRSFNGDYVTLQTGTELKNKLEHLGKCESVPLEIALLACYILLLSKYSGQDNVFVGVAYDSIQHSEAEGPPFITVVAGQLDRETTFREFVKVIGNICDQSLNSPGIPYFELVKELGLDRDPSRNPLFDALFKMGCVEVCLTKYDFALETDIKDESIQLTLEYDTNLFAKASMERLLQHYLNILEQLASDVDQRLSELDMISAAERERLVYGWNDTDIHYPYERSIAQMLEEQVLQRPEEIAVAMGADRLSYRQLHEHSNRVAHALHAKGIGEGDVVVVMAERSLALIIGLLGVLKAGAAYTPVDPGYPAERLRYLLHNSRAKLLLVQDKFKDCIAETGAEVATVEELLVAGFPTENLSLTYRPERLMYVLYTSGSTGNPKGAMIPSHSFVNLLHWYTREFTFTSNDRILLIASASFDLAQKNLYAPLVTGGRLILFEPGLYDYEQMSETIEREGITVINCTPSAFYPLVETNADDDYQKLKSLRWVFLGGEPIHMTKLGPWLRSIHCHAEIVNTYGPTECTDIASYYRLRSEDWNGKDELPIGQPIDNVRLYVVDNEMKIVPEGMEGELCIGGVGVGLGYYNAPELTKERFVYGKELPEEKVYKTGDMVKRKPDGNLLFIGRVDHQVKVRGFRIEIEEIEKKLLDYAQVKEAVVTAVQEEDGDTTLRAYVVTVDGTTADMIRDYLQKELPGYMVPQYIVLLEEMPLTPNGKIDRKALPLPAEMVRSAEEDALLQGETEQRLAKLWEDVLGIGKVGAYDNFFRLGGHSLKAIALISRIKKMFGVSISIQKLFRAPTVQQLAEVIRQSPQNSFVPIPEVGKQEYHRLSREQERMYILQQLEEIGTAYNVTWAAHVRGPLDIVRCRTAFAALTRRHETLRTSFEIVGDTLAQKVMVEVEGFFDYEDSPGGIPEQLIAQFVRPFDLGTGPLFRVKVIRIGDEEHLLLLDMHHIITDGISLHILLREFAALYEGETLEPLRMQYKDYAIWQSKQRAVHHEQERYWMDLFQGEIPVLNMPLDYPRPSSQSFKGDKISIQADRHLTKKLMQVTEETGTTLYMVLLAAYYVLLHKYTGQEDIIVGSPIAGRRHAELENIMGMFVNTLALRNFPNSGKTFRGFLAEVRENCLKAYENQECPFEQLVEKLQTSRDVSRNPLFDTMFVLQNMEGYIPSLESVQMAVYPINNHISKFDLTLEATESEDGSIRLSLEFCIKLFTKDSMERLLQHYLNLLEQMASDVDLRLADMDMLTAAARERLVYGWNDTDIHYPYERSIAQMLEEQVLQRPEEIAVAMGADRLSYRQLHEHSNRVAHALHAKGIGEGDVVVVMAERSLALIIGLLGVLKAGAAYTPVDPGYPAERLRYLLHNSRAKLLLVQDKFKDCIAETGAEVATVEELLVAGFPTENLSLTYRPERLMYVLYTSGSTGNPKGAMIPSHSFVNLLHWYTREFTFTSNDRILLIASASFDLAQKNLYAPLVTGGRLILFEPGLYDYEQMSETIEREGITVINCTPSAFYPLVETNADDDYQKLKSLRWVFLGGEPIHMTKLGPWLRSIHCLAEIVNTYGPTECTDIASYYRLRSEDWNGKDELPIGKPIDNIRLYVVDNEMKIVPEGMEGELCIGGVGVGLGYYNAPELTKERFVNGKELPEEKVYKTGDMVKRRPDGNLMFIGRTDHQVKVRGFRIEIEEIEKKLLDHAQVKEAVITAGQDEDGDTTLRAYVVTMDGTTADMIRDYLLEELPGYMVPQYIVLLEEMPLTPNGKIDRKALPLPGKMVSLAKENDFLEGETEHRLAEMWMEVLGIGKIGANDNFFRLGGHSLKALNLMRKMNQAFHMKENISLLFQKPTIRLLAKHIKSSQKNRLPDLKVASPSAYYPASPAQKRLFMIDKLLGKGTTYNVPVIRRIKGALDEERLGEAMKKLVKRHDSLRTTFELEAVSGMLRQKVFSDVSFTYSVYELTTEEAISMFSDFVRPFRLDKPPLLRTALIKLTDKEECILIIDMHHIITDGISIGILLKDLAALYKNQEMEVPKLQYKDYAVWYNQLMNTEEWKRQEEYWLEVFKEPVRPLQLSLNRSNALTGSANSRTVYTSVDAKTAENLSRLAQETESTLFMVLMAAFTVLLSTLSNQEDIVVGTPTAGRHHEGLENIVGMFVNTLSIRSFPRGSQSFQQYLNELKETLLEVYENQDYPFDNLVEKLNVPREINGNPIFNIMFQYENMVETEQIGGFEMIPMAYDGIPSKFDIHLAVVEEKNRTLQLEMTYRESFLTEEAAQEFIAQFLGTIQMILQDSKMSLRDITKKESLQP